MSPLGNDSKKGHSEGTPTHRVAAAATMGRRLQPRGPQELIPWRRAALLSPPSAERRPQCELPLPRRCHRSI